MCAKERRRRFIVHECNHVYQKTVKGFVLFYDREDYLLCYMILSVKAKKYGVKVLKICFMIDHIHMLIEAPSCKVMSDFIRDYSSVYIHEYNTSVGRSGQMFHKSYGSAPKKGGKKTRSAIIYIGNNPVEKKLCIQAEDYRWNFLKYIVKSYPFSTERQLAECSRQLRRSISIVNAASKAGRFLNYNRLRDIFDSLTESEKEYLTDHIIKSYPLIDADRLWSYYEDWNQMVTAMHSTTGSEHDIKEAYSNGSDQIYHDMKRYLVEKGFKPVRSVITLPLDQKIQLADDLRLHTGASPYEIKKFLHI